VLVVSDMVLYKELYSVAYNKKTRPYFPSAYSTRSSGASHVDLIMPNICEKFNMLFEFFAEYSVMEPDIGFEWVIPAFSDFTLPSVPMPIGRSLRSFGKNWELVL